MTKYNKLVRDKVPEIIRAKGRTPIIRTLSDKEYLKRLMEKLFEEVDEFDEDQSVEEMADILEVLIALANALNITQAELKSVRAKKATAHGGFKKRIFLERVED